MKLVIEGIPISKSRHRCGCNRNRPVSYDPQTQEMTCVKRQIKAIMKKNINSKNKQIAIEASELTMVKSFGVTLTFLFPTPYSATCTNRNMKLWGLEVYNKKPDIDNLEKFYLDCLTGLIWDDDCQVICNKSRKYYAEKPRVEIEIMAKKEMNVSDNTEAVLKIVSPSELKEFINDASQFSALSLEMVNALLPQYEEKDAAKQLERITLMLMEFADKHSEKLKKINKIPLGAP